MRMMGSYPSFRRFLQEGTHNRTLLRRAWSHGPAFGVSTSNSRRLPEKGAGGIFLRWLTASGSREPVGIGWTEAIISKGSPDIRQMMLNTRAGAAIDQIFLP